MDPASIEIFYHPKDRLRLTVRDDRSYVTVKPVWAAPLSRPDKYLALLNGKGDEIGLIEDPGTLDSASRAAVEEELHRRYLTSTIHVVQNAKTEFGATYWHVITDRGERDFVTQSLQENAQWLSPTHILLIDVDGNRFEIPNVEALDLGSRQMLGKVL